MKMKMKRDKQDKNPKRFSMSIDVFWCVFLECCLLNVNWNSSPNGFPKILNMVVNVAHIEKVINIYIN